MRRQRRRWLCALIKFPFLFNFFYFSHLDLFLLLSCSHFCYISFVQLLLLNRSLNNFPSLSIECYALCMESFFIYIHIYFFPFLSIREYKFCFIYLFFFVNKTIVAILLLKFLKFEARTRNQRRRSHTTDKKYIYVEKLHGRHWDNSGLIVKVLYIGMKWHEKKKQEKLSIITFVFTSSSSSSCTTTTTPCLSHQIYFSFLSISILLPILAIDDHYDEYKLYMNMQPSIQCTHPVNRNLVFVAIKWDKNKNKQFTLNIFVSIP